MPDLGKVIKGLQIERECVSRDCDRDCGKCDLVQDRDWLLSVYDEAIALLKEQEAKNGYWINPTSQDCHCSECGEQPVHEAGESVPLYDYCPYCGAKMEVKWNE